MVSHFEGWIDFCTQTSIAGWTTAPWLAVYVNGDLLCRIESGGSRPDLVAAGIPSGRTFGGVFPRSLWLDDRVTVRLPDDNQLVPSERASHVPRLRQLLSGLDLEKPGLEFGPLDRPIIPRSRAIVYYVDHEDKEGLTKKYIATLRSETAKIPETDFIWTGDRSLHDVVGARQFGWVIASHVGEHIADFIGWIQHLAAVLEKGGCVSLALPHRDRTFDALRPLSSFEDLVAAHIMNLRRPSAQQVLQHMLGVSEYWKIDLKKPENLPELHNAINVAKSAASGSYIDVHCSVFTPESFISCYSLLASCGLVPLTLSSVIPTDRDEFVVKLVK